MVEGRSHTPGWLHLKHSHLKVFAHEVLSHVELENKTEALHRDTLLCSTDGSKWDEWSTVEKTSASYLTDLEFWLGCF